MYKIAFLFLTINGVYHESYWKGFFKGHESHYSMYVHAKQPISPKSWFKPYELGYSVQTSWSHTMKAQIAMLKEALADPDNAMFVFISETTLPLQDFKTTYNTIMKNHKTIIPYTRNPHADPSNKFYKSRNLSAIPLEYQKKNSQWIILNRHHAQLMANDTKYLNIICSYPCDNEHYPSTFLALHNKLSEVINKVTTFVHWKKIKPGKLPTIFEDMYNKREYHLILHALKKKYLFARKFSKNCTLKPLNKHLAYYQQSFT